ncbi:MAG: tRNA pseudouridine(55) synthase TruB [Deltaproteobacteria bacterium]|nr:tRNA pseudouridine(55) synthase TruB [Deltaproteobacteria bacterium]MBW2084515.1 tRNA pseudouridine(55) synthase TruB [Deltaproteobacteria bacterium]
MKSNRYNSSLSGVLILDKPAGLTSFEVVRRIRKALGVKRVGHTGTLDPMATGLLLLCINQATKLVPFLQSGEKGYAGRMILGLCTDTDDITGRVTSRKTDFDLNPEEIIRVAAEFVGLIEQVPPQYAALKHQGQPAYKLARRGEKVPTKAREVMVHELTVTEIDLPGVSFLARVSKGTYIRSLVADWGRQLGTGACLESLKRLTNASFTLKQAITLEEAEILAQKGRLAERIIPLENALSFMPVVQVPGVLIRLVENGQPLPLNRLENFNPQPGPVQVISPETDLLAVYKYDPRTADRKNESLTPLRVLGRS